MYYTDYIGYIYNFISFFVIFYLANLVLKKYHKLQILINIFLLLLFSTLSIYHNETKSFFDPSAATENFGLLFSKLGFDVVWYEFTHLYFEKLSVTLLIALIFNYKFGLFNLIAKNNNIAAFKNILLALFLVFGFKFSPITYNEFQSISYFSYRQITKKNDLSRWQEKKSQLPDDWQTVEYKNSKNNFRPNIFLIIMESFNVNFVEARSNNGLEYTPFFNKLIKKGHYFENMYGNSIQSVRGQFAIFCSSLPAYTGFISSEFQQLHIDCIPKILEENGYKASLYSDFYDKSFNNQDAFFKRTGFNAVIHSNRSELTKLDNKKELLWNFGHREDFFYKQVFKNIDRQIIKSTAPMFNTIIAVNNHMPFKHIPKEFHKIYPDPKDSFERMANSINAQDIFLKTFFNELDKRPKIKNNSVVIIIGDHSYPALEHQNRFSDLKAYEENFKIPLLILSSNDNKAQRYKELRTQLDLKPTLINMLGLNLTTHSAGYDVFSRTHPGTALMVQPYDGTYFVSIKYPYKLLFHLRSDRYYYYDLAKDPNETTPLDPINIPKRILDKLELGFAKIIRNQECIEQNCMWKPQK